MGPKNGLERGVWQFYTICDKNQLLKVKNEKVTVILVLRSAAGQLQVTSGSAQKFVWGSMVKFQKNNCKLFIVDSGKTGFPGTNRRLAFLKIVWRIV
jgi:hypothetical protein